MNAYLPPRLEAGGRIWGFGVNLYAMRSARNWGMGDFTDLQNIIRAAAQLGAGIVGVNPLHALHWNDPEAASPYAPTSRFFLNPLYIDVEAVPEFADPEVQKLVGSSAFRDDLRAAREASHIRYDLVGSLKSRVLEKAYDAWRRRAPKFGAFFRDNERSKDLANFQLVTEYLTVRGSNGGWTTWPVKFHDPSGLINDYEIGNERRQYFVYLQQVADEQLAAIARAAQELDVTLYRDLAVGVPFDSADVWMHQADYDFDHTIGAPPDPLGPLGQDWGLPPALTGCDGAAGRRDVLRTLAREHALRRRVAHRPRDVAAALFWIPRGGRPGGRNVRRLSVRSFAHDRRRGKPPRAAAWSSAKTSERSRRAFAKRWRATASSRIAC